MPLPTYFLRNNQNDLTWPLSLKFREENSQHLPVLSHLMSGHWAARGRAGTPYHHPPFLLTPKDTLMRAEMLPSAHFPTWCLQCFSQSSCQLIVSLPLPELRCDWRRNFKLYSDWSIKTALRLEDGYYTIFCLVYKSSVVTGEKITNYILIG